MKRAAWNKGLKMWWKPSRMKGKIPWNKGKTLGKEYRNKISESLKGNQNRVGKKCKLSLQTRERMSEAKKGNKCYRWIEDRGLVLYEKQQRTSGKYLEWRNSIWLRDNFKCKIGNPDCKGRIEAHHILPWKNYPELRYEVNNGITLCQFHHPRKIKDVMGLVLDFQQMIQECK